MPKREAADHGEHTSGAPASPPQRSLLDAPEILDSSFGGVDMSASALPPAGSGAAASPARVTRSSGRLSLSTEGSESSPGRRDQRPLNSPLRPHPGPGAGAKGGRPHLVAHNPHMDDDAVVGPGTHSLIASAPPPAHGHAHPHAHAHGAHGNPGAEPAGAAGRVSPVRTSAEEEAYVGEEEEEEEYDDEDGDFEEFDPFLFMKHMPPYEQVVPVPRPAVLPPKARGAPPVTLVLDLDETLVHCSIEEVPSPDLVFPVEFNGVVYQVYVRKRPGMDAFLKRVSRSFEVVVFTASQQVYAEKLLDKLDPKGTLIHHRLYRDACVEFEGNFLKDLDVLGRDLRRTVIVDNSPHAFAFHVDNGVPIESWFDDEADQELGRIVPFLESLRKAGDVRPAVRSQFRLAERIANA